MADSAVDRFLGRPGAAAQRGEPKDAGFAAEAGSNPRMIDFGFKNGNRTSLPYAYLVSVKLIGNTTVEMIFTEFTVKITGRNLGTLYQNLSAQTVRRVEESVTGFDDDQQAHFLEAIALEKRESGHRV